MLGFVIAIFIVLSAVVYVVLWLYYSSCCKSGNNPKPRKGERECRRCLQVKRKLQFFGLLFSYSPVAAFQSAVALLPAMTSRESVFMLKIIIRRFIMSHKNQLFTFRLCRPRLFICRRARQLLFCRRLEFTNTSLTINGPEPSRLGIIGRLPLPCRPE